MPEVRTPQMRTQHHGTPHKLEKTTEAPPVPTSLGTHGRAAWSFVWLNAPVKPSDFDFVERYCYLHDLRAGLLASVEEDGILSQGSTGQKVVHPALRAAHTFDQTLNKMAQSLGLTPEARARLNIVDDEGDEFNEFLSNVG